MAEKFGVQKVSRSFIDLYGTGYGDASACLLS